MFIYSNRSFLVDGISTMATKPISNIYIFWNGTFNIRCQHFWIFFLHSHKQNGPALSVQSWCCSCQTVLPTRIAHTFSVFWQHPLNYIWSTLFSNCLNTILFECEILLYILIYLQIIWDFPSCLSASTLPIAFLEREWASSSSSSLSSFSMSFMHFFSPSFEVL